MIYCPNCKRPTSSDKRVCPHCSQPLPESLPPNPAQKREQKRLRLGEILLSAGLITVSDLENALEKQRETGVRIGALLVADNIITESELVQALSHQSGIHWVDLKNMSVDAKMLSLVPLSIARKHRVFPLDARRIDNTIDVLFLAMEDAMDKEAIRVVAGAANMHVQPLYATPSSIETAIAMHEKENTPLKPSAPTVPQVSFGDPEAKSKPLGRKKVSVLTMLDGTVIPWAHVTKTGFIGIVEEEKLLNQIRELPDDETTVARLKEIVVELIAALLRKKLLFPGELSELAKKIDKKE